MKQMYQTLTSNLRMPTLTEGANLVATGTLVILTYLTIKLAMNGLEVHNHHYYYGEPAGTLTYSQPMSDA